jgi:hypothetical protein
LYTQERPAVPNREALRALYDKAVGEINATRGGRLTTEFYAKTGDAVFNAGVAALEDCYTKTKRMHTVSAPAGAGKTSFSYALIAAVTRYAEANPDGPYGCVYIVDQISRAEKVHQDLSALLPGKVAVWFTGHEFDRGALKFYPVAVVTHKFFVDVNGHHARNVDRNRDGRFRQRALTIVDEQPADVKASEITLSEAQSVREALNDAYPDIKDHLDNLFQFMEPFSYTPANRIYRPGIEVDRNAVSEQLAWFTSEQAKRITHSAASKKIAGVDQLCAVAKAMAQGCGFVVSGNPVRFVGWESKLTVNLSAGTILLDATADIDGVSRVVSWRVDAEVPQARYDNLEIVHVPQHTTKRLKEYFRTAPNQRAYVKWVEQTIVEHMAPGERGLVICKKTLFDNERVPNWPDGDERFKDTESYTKRYEWDLEGRKLCATHWGTGVGSNDWQDADVVFLCDEFFIPRRTHAATVQGLLEQKAHEGPLGSMKTLNSKSQGVDVIDLGHRLRWMKQLALRGKARSYDEHGVCGKQRLVVACDLTTLMANVSKLFPGAKMRTTGAGDDAKLIDRVLEILNGPKMKHTVLTTTELGKRINRDWRKASSHLMTPEFKSALEGIGWEYKPGAGRRAGCFERRVPDEALAA